MTSGNDAKQPNDTRFATRVRRFAMLALLTLCSFAASSASEVAQRDAAVPLTPPADLAHRLILIGDTGSPNPPEEVLRALGRWGDVAPERTTVLFLGDNAYPEGLSEEDPTRAKAILQRWIQDTAAAKIFIPGNHDWGSPRRISAVASEQAFLDAIDDVEFLPKGGCPGPVARTLVPAGQLTRAVTVIFLDLQWWHLAPHERPACGSIETPAQMLAALEAELESRRDEWVIVANHRPLPPRTDSANGAPGNWFDGVRHLFDNWDVEALDLVGHAMSSAPPLIAVGGHAHSLQVIRGQAAASYVLVSGAGSEDRIVPFDSTSDTVFAAEHPGFLVIDFHGTARGDRVTLAVVEAGIDSPVFTMDLASAGVRSGRAL